MAKKTKTRQRKAEAAASAAHRQAQEARDRQHQESEDLEKNREGLRAYRGLLVEANIRGQEVRDSTLLTLSSGALGISFAFIDHFVTGAPRLPILLFGAWGCWAVSVVFQLGNYWLAERAFDWQIAHTDLRLAGKNVDASAVNKWDAYVRRINSLVMVLFVVGVISLGSFVYENYGTGTKEKCECQKVCCALTNGATTGAAAASDTGSK